ncbi:D-aminoacylase [bacterium]|nr:MAG: D-aminoacylase [bacterium]
MLLAAVLAIGLQPGLVIRNGTLYDGTGGLPRRVDVRIVGDTIRQVGVVDIGPADAVIDAKDLAVAPGFIDAHSHADGGIFDDPDAETQIRQGITTAIVGVDGGSNYPLRDWFGRLERQPSALNFASYVGHGTVRKAVMGEEARKAKPEERRAMEAIVDREMRDGAIGLSSGLEYQPGRYSDTSELIDLARAASRRRGLYASHMRNEDNQAFEAIDELVSISREAGLPGQIDHIKLGSARVWGRTSEVFARMSKSDVQADVYPYLYWQSTIRVIIATEQFDDRKQWEQGLADIGGPGHILLTTFSPNPSWQGKTIEDLAKTQGKDPISLIQEIIARCYGPGQKGSESVVVTAMSNVDLKAFLAHPLVSICSDGGLHGSHPRGAGSFPRVLGHYVREEKTLTLQEAIRKMTSLPASRFRIKGRGLIAPGKKADLVLFDPQTVRDTATTQQPQSPPVGISTVIVNGVPVLRDGTITHAHPGRPLRRQ